MALGFKAYRLDREVRHTLVCESSLDIDRQRIQRQNHPLEIHPLRDMS